MLEIECLPGKVFTFHGEELRAPDFSTSEEKLAFVLRRVCHLMLERIDDKGLQDVCQSLAEFYEFYKPRELPQRLLPQVRTRDVAVASRATSPAFLIQEE
jgi:hypothetical protein